MVTPDILHVRLGNWAFAQAFLFKAQFQFKRCHNKLAPSSMLSILPLSLNQSSVILFTHVTFGSVNSTGHGFGGALDFTCLCILIGNNQYAPVYETFTVDSTGEKIQFLIPFSILNVSWIHQSQQPQNAVFSHYLPKTIHFTLSR